MTIEATITQVAPGVLPRSGTASPRCCLYLRASSTKKTRAGDGEEYRQRPEIQEERLRRLCEQRGWAVASVYCDRASGRKEARPELNRMVQDARRGLFDVVAVAAFDRVARSVRHLVTALEEFRNLGINFVSLGESIDTATPMGRTMFGIIAVMAELESDLISERTAVTTEYTRLHVARRGITVDTSGQRHQFAPAAVRGMLRRACHAPVCYDQRFNPGVLIYIFTILYKGAGSAWVSRPATPPRPALTEPPAPSQPRSATPRMASDNAPVGRHQRPARRT